MLPWRPPGRLAARDGARPGGAWSACEVQAAGAVIAIRSGLGTFGEPVGEGVYVGGGPGAVAGHRAVFEAGEDGVAVRGDIGCRP